MLHNVKLTRNLRFARFFQIAAPMAPTKITALFAKSATDTAAPPDADTPEEPVSKRARIDGPEESADAADQVAAPTDAAQSLEDRTMHASWRVKLASEFSKPYFQSLRSFLSTERSGSTIIYPPEDEVYSWSRFAPLPSVNVVILGQDPYINPRQAHGLAFSVNEGVAPPPSLVNMFKELKNDIPGFETPKHGSLVSWAKQGVLLLNAALTVRAGQCTLFAIFSCFY